MPDTAASVYIGIDVGTSQVRACAIGDSRQTLAFASVAMPPPGRAGSRVEQEAQVWWEATTAALDHVLNDVDRDHVRAVAVDGTSGTIVLTSREGHPLAPALMYSDQSSLSQAQRVALHAPVDSPARGASSALARLLALLEQQQAISNHVARDGLLALHQADWIAAQLSGRPGMSDENNALKLGYDVVARCWPPWLAKLDLDPDVLPRVVPPGTPLATVAPRIASRFGLSRDVKVVAGTTDGVAAAIAAGIEHAGDAMTSLGSTLVLKVVSDRPVASAAHGVYTHRLGERWLAGGASNTGGAVLASFFTPNQIECLSSDLDAATPTDLDYYPLLGPGERFPVNDPTLAPRLMPRPEGDRMFLHGLLESMARIERDGYRLLASLGAPYPTSVRTAGGGAVNEAWRRIRERMLGVPVTRAATDEAACGTALLAWRGARA
jgi:sugar (pentulose or hexulose) kinase